MALRIPPPGRSRRPLRTLLGLAVLAGATLAACEQPAPRGRVHSERIGSIGADYRRGSLAVSHDHRRLAWVKQVGDACWVVVDGRKGPRYARCTNPVFSPDGKTVAYWAAATLEDPPRVRLVVDGEEQPTATSDQGPIAFARRGGAWAALAPVRDEAAGAADGGGPEPTPTPARRLVAMRAGVTLGEHRDSSAPVVSPDGRHVAFLALDEEGRHALVVDGEVVRTFGPAKVPFLPALKQSTSNAGLEPEATVRYLADGSLAGVALSENGWTVFHGDSIWAEYAGLRLPPDAGFEVTQSDLLARSAILAGSLALADEAGVACWWERLEGDADRWRVLCNGKPIDEQLCDAPSYEQPIEVAADGRSAMYVCAIASPDPSATGDVRRLYVVLPGAKLGPYRFVWALERSADARHFAFAAADGVDDPWYYVVDGRRYDGPWQHVFPPKFSPDGSSVIWAASPDPDGKRVDLVRDGEVLTRAEMVMAPPLFGPGNRAQWAVKRGRSVRRVIFD
jgi:hypothetical protein